MSNINRVGRPRVSVIDKKRNHSLKMNDKEWGKCVHCAGLLGLSVSEYLRALVKEDYEKRFSDDLFYE